MKLNNEKLKILVSITGASGGIYGIRFIGYLLQYGYEVNLIVSENGQRVLKHELILDTNITSILSYIKKEFTNITENKLKLFEPDNLFAPSASGSSRYDVMVIIPCSMKTLGAIAGGYSQSLIERSADVILKEKRKLIVVPRETPFSSIHLESMLKIDQAGGIILPAIPGFYNKPQSVIDLVDYVIGKIFNIMDIEQGILSEWGTN
jgi:4-hydroxy-3-polyprenylbenzoate decarboxylase